MKTRYAKREGCVPDLAAAMRVNMIPPHFQRNPVMVELDDTQLVKSCHLHADGRRFNFRDVYGTPTDKEWEYAYLTQLSYTAEDGSTQIAEVEPRNPHIIEKGFGTTFFGYVTKVNEKRWGVMVHLNWRTGDTQIIPDQGSPIIGALIQLI